jgi:dTDP-4-dehydrorhamnose 3,5-epimerase
MRGTLLLNLLSSKFGASIMQIISTPIPEVLIIEPQVFGDDRGFFLESYHHRKFQEKTGLDVEFVQDNHSRSIRNVLRGLHYQVKEVQGKLVRAVIGEVLDVAVDLRQSSPTFGKSVGCVLSAANKRQLWIPPGFGHGFVVFSEVAEVLYKATNYYAPEYDRAILWNDPDLAIDWQLQDEPILSSKDQNASPFKTAELFP